MAPGIVLKVGPRERRKIWRNRLPGKRKGENESVGLSDCRKMRFARSLYRTQSFCNSLNVARARFNVIRIVNRSEQQ